MTPGSAVRYFKPLIFFICLLPLIVPSIRIVTNNMSFFPVLGANPVEAITHMTGEWALRFLLITLTVTPLQKVSGWLWPLRFRRMLGLFAFFYAVMHFLTYLVLDKFFWWQDIWEDIFERPYITVGFAAFVLLLPLALTSTKGMMRRLQYHWNQLHRLIYPIAILAVVHFWWLVKADIAEPLVYAVVLFALLGFRVINALQRNSNRPNYSIPAQSTD